MPQSNALSSIDNSLVDECISTPTKQHIIRQLWGNEALIASNTRREPDFSAYWSYYSRQCREALHDNGRHVSARTHRDILEIIELLKGGHVRRDIRSLLCSKLSNTAAANGGYLLDGSINLAASLLLMVNCGNQPYGFSGRFQLNWEGRLEDVVGTYFKQPPVLGNEMIKLERVFNARSLEKIAGIKIVWTDNLMDHLRLTDDDSKVEIFHHASFLRAQKESSLFPPTLINETLHTLALLFPAYPNPDKEMRRWLSNFPSSLNIDPGAIECGHLKTDDRQIERFVYWHDRLVTLKQVFNEAQPKNLSQWWHDRRNGVQWYTFWVAILVLGLTLIFGLTQCIEGALQVYIAYKALPSQDRHGPL